MEYVNYIYIGQGCINGMGEGTLQLPLKEVRCFEIVALNLHTKSVIFTSINVCFCLFIFLYVYFFFFRVYFYIS